MTPSKDMRVVLLLAVCLIFLSDLSTPQTIRVTESCKVNQSCSANSDCGTDPSCQCAVIIGTTNEHGSAQMFEKFRKVELKNCCGNKN
uniref:Uncharacterized protein n=1 Tax=Rhipicephalus zambeziensis TaxID=60191 RepID=A0A224YFJ2_9ACAR